MKKMGLNFIPLNTSKITKSDIQTFEKKYNLMLPDELTDLFLESNDLILEYPLIDCVGFDGGVMPERWTGISSNGMNYLLDLYNGTLGHSAIPFARDPGGNIFTIQVINGKQMGVFYIDLDELEIIDGIEQYKSRRIASNIHEFANLIKITQ